MSGRWPAPTRQDHLKFCEVDGWVQRSSARGMRGTDHLYFERDLGDGRILRTKISHPPGRETYGPALWRRILKDQLQVNDDTFWAAVQDGTPPRRGGDHSPPRRGIPVGVAHKLTTLVGLSPDDLAELTPEQAVERLNRYWTENPG